jgi:hypothetical protein
MSRARPLPASSRSPIPGSASRPSRSGSPIRTARPRRARGPSRCATPTTPGRSSSSMARAATTTIPARAPRPKRDLGGWYLGDEDDPTYRLHQCFYRGYFAVAGAPAVEVDGARVIITESKPRTHVGYGTGARWSGHGAYSTSSRARDSTSPISPPPTRRVLGMGERRTQHFVTGNAALASGAIFRMTFLGAGTPSDDMTNSSCIMLPDTERTTSNYHEGGHIRRLGHPRRARGGRQHQPLRVRGRRVDQRSDRARGSSPRSRSSG